MIPTDTPWGCPDSTKVLAEGIVVFSTPRHGGILLSAERWREMPKALREVPTFAGGHWYEEDCDVALVILSWPDLFGGHAVRDAYHATAQASTDPSRRRWYGIMDRWEGRIRERCEALMQEWEREHADHWVGGSCWTEGDGWAMQFKNVSTGSYAWRKISTAEYLSLPSVCTSLPGVPFNANV
jgi:hypothetical protein